MNDVVLLPTV